MYGIINEKVYKIYLLFVYIIYMWLKRKFIVNMNRKIECM